MSTGSPDGAVQAPSTFSRGGFVARALAAAGALSGLTAAFERAGLASAAAAGSDLTLDTLNGLAAFVVPGRDDYSSAQGQSTTEPGGVEAFAGVALVQGLDFALPGLSANAAALLNNAALLVRSDSGVGQFASPYANLAFAEKAAAFALLEGHPAFAPFRSFVGTLPGLAAYLSYSEVGVFDPASRTIAARPIGWQLSSYDGVADGRDEFVGYLENRRRADA